MLFEFYNVDPMAGFNIGPTSSTNFNIESVHLTYIVNLDSANLNIYKLQKRPTYLC
jgi:hypothetical protein